jgi:hypothetical protein
MPTLAADRTKRADVLQQLADSRFDFPSPEHLDWETVVNEPEPQMGVQLRSGGWIYPDIVVTEEPGHFIRMVAIVALRHEVTEIEAIERWLPLSKAGACYLFVPAGQAGAANRLCRSLGIKLAGIRTWRRTPAFGLETLEAYSGPDVVGAIAALLPDALRPRTYRVQRRAIDRSYGRPDLAQRGGDQLPAGASQAALALAAGDSSGRPADNAVGYAPAQAPAPAHQAGVPEGIHMPPPSPFPFAIAAGMILTGFGVIFPAELLSAGLAAMLFGVIGWLLEDVRDYAHGAGHDYPRLLTPDAPKDIHMPPPSLSPIVMSLGVMLTAFGVIFPAELLGAGLTFTLLGLLSWLKEDIRDFGLGGHANHA